MGNINLKVALTIYGAIHIVEGIIMWFVPGKIADLFGISDLGSGYIFVMLGGASIAAGLLFAVAGLNPLQNINGIRFAVLWSALLLIGQLYSLAPEYVTFNHIWFSVVANIIFLAAFLIFYPRKQAESQ